MKNNKLVVKGIASLILVSLFSLTVYASDQEITVAKSEKENSLEQFLYVRWQEEEEDLLASVSEEEWNMIQEGKREIQKTAVVILQPQVAAVEKVPQTELSGQATDTEALVETAETEMSELGEVYQEVSESNISETAELLEKSPETESPETESPETESLETESPETESPETESPEIESPGIEGTETSIPVQKVSLTKKQKEYIKKVSKTFSEVVVIFNGCVLEDDLCLVEYSNVIVKVLEVTVKKAELEEMIKFLNIEETRNDYYQRIDKIRERLGEDLETELPKTMVLSKEAGEESSSEKVSGIEDQGPVLNDRGLSLNRARSSNNDDSNDDEDDSNDTNTNTSTNTNSRNKDITLTLTIDDMSAGEDMLTASCAIASTKEITNGKITITYDANIMTLDSADAEDLEAFEDNNMTSRINDVNNSGSSEGTIEMIFSSTQGVKLKGDMLYLYFDLMSSAKVGDVYELKLKVNEMKNGSADLTTDVKQSTYKVKENDEGDVEEDETESEAETTQMTSKSQMTDTTSSGSAAKKTTAPKTGDENNTTLWLIMEAVSMLIVLYAYGKKKSVSK
ncbi:MULTISPECIES: hypothetical protein [Robinsoniella]|uniref:hypothetical protein n=1 Tax=Robinsoniella TaxID=588605 RepID=UPI000486AABD|nr:MULTISPECIES: hypothetical protein [Robinsoniella]